VRRTSRGSSKKGVNEGEVVEYAEGATRRGPARKTCAVLRRHCRARVEKAKRVGGVIAHRPPRRTRGDKRRRGKVSLLKNSNTRPIESTLAYENGLQVTITGRRDACGR